VSEARKVFMYFVNRELGLNSTEIGKYFGITGVAVAKGVKAGELLVSRNNLKLIS